MIDIKQYLLVVITASIIGSIILNLFNKNSAHAAVIKLLVSSFIFITAISPWLSVRFDIFTDYWDSLNVNADAIIHSAQNDTEENIQSSIRAQIEEYIYNEAISLGAQLDVCISLSGEQPYIPEYVSITGDISPYAKKQLQTMINNELGIPEVNQVWN